MPEKGKAHAAVPVFFPEGGGRHIRIFPEHLGKVIAVRKTGLFRNFIQSQFRVQQQILGFADTERNQILLRGHARILLEQPQQGGGGYAMPLTIIPVNLMIVEFAADVFQKFP